MDSFTASEPLPEVEPATVGESDHTPDPIPEGQQHDSPTLQAEISPTPVTRSPTAAQTIAEMQGEDISSDLVSAGDSTCQDTEPAAASTSRGSAKISDSELDGTPKAKPVWRQWLTEILLCLGSLLAFTIIIAVLRAYEGQALPKLPMNITLNTFLAFFTSPSKAAVMAVVAEALAQWKWNLASTKEPNSKVYHFSILDSSSRGPWGSWLLIWNFKWRHVASLAAGLSLLSTLTSPITQQMLTLDMKLAPTPANASIPMIRNYVGKANADIATALTDATIKGMLSQPKNPAKPLPASCGTVECTFEPYQTLGVCMKAQDISHMLTIREIPNSTFKDWTTTPLADETYTYEDISGGPDGIVHAWGAALSPDLEFVTPVSYSFMVAARDYSLAFQDNDDEFTALAHIYTVWSNAGNVSYPEYNRTGQKPWEFRAAEILYYACIQTLNTSYIGGRSHTEIIASTNIPLETANNGPFDNLYCNGTSGALPRPQEISHICEYASFERHIGETYLRDPSAPDDPNAFYSFDRFLASMIKEDVILKLTGFLYFDGIYGHPVLFTNYNSEYLFYTLLLDDGREIHEYDTKKQFDAVTEYFNYMAISLSNMIRSHNGNQTNGSQEHKGIAYAETPFVAVKWGWAAFLATEIVLSCVFLAVTIHKTVKLGTPVLKSSEIATLLASTEELRNELGSIKRIQEASDKAKKVAMRLDDGRLVLG
ncbi:hypothetical protein OQA88_7629 [Cercophora sp. LCS_1]